MADKVWVTRNADGVWEAHNSDGASMQVGKGPGLFNPSDLLKVALAACGGFSSEAAMTRLLGDDAQVRIDAGGDYDSRAEGPAFFADDVRELHLGIYLREKLCGSRGSRTRILSDERAFEAGAGLIVAAVLR